MLGVKYNKMSYTILNTDGTTLLILADGAVDQAATSLDLVGRNVTPYGQYFNNNLIKLLANSANTAGSPPRSPLTGQLWYDTTAKRLKVYDNDFTTVSGSIVSSVEPNTLIEGDLWFNTTDKQVFVYDGNNSVLVGPSTPGILGQIGWVLPDKPILDNNNNVQNVTMLMSYGKFIGIASSQTFTLSQADSLKYFNTSTIQVVEGLTILGNISYTGNMLNLNISGQFGMGDSCNSELDNDMGLKHAAGAQGPQGPQGYTGSAGYSGPQGYTGDIGPQGPIGPQGYTGSAGYYGSVGVQGPQGYTGSIGYTGSVGVGAPGPQGIPGAATYDIYNFINGMPLANEVLIRVLAVRMFTMPKDFVGSLAQCKTPATRSTPVINVNKNGVNFGTITFQAGAYVGKFSSISDVTFNITDEFSVQIDNSVDEPDETFSDLTFSFYGTSF